MDRSLYDGLVTIRTLPLHQAAEMVGHIPDGRIAMPAGELGIVLNGPEVRYIATLEFVEGAHRGNHVHRVKSQWLYVISGHIRGTFEHVETKIRETADLQSGDLLHISPSVAHVFTGIEPSLALEACSLPFDPTDTIPYQLTPHT